MENSGTRVITVVLGILLVIGCGIGGYYIGWYLDNEAAKQAATTQKKTAEADTSGPKTFKNTDLGIEFTYPGNWTKHEVVLDDKKTNEISIVSPDGSYFYYIRSSTAGTTVTCDENDPQGKEGDNKLCEYYLKDGVRFAKYKDTALSNNEFGDYWIIAESSGEEESGKYTYNSSNGFYYQSMTANDLNTLDDIMKSVVRK